MEYRFQNPELLLLLIIPLLLLLLRGRRGPRAAIRFPGIQLARFGVRQSRSRAGRWLGLLRILGLACCVIAIARPQAGTSIEQFEASGIDIMLAVDLSGSMWAHDFEVDGDPVDRLTAVKRVLQPFVDRRPNDRMGLVVFAQDAYVVSPLTLNHRWMKQNIDRLFIGIIDPNKTAIGSAVATSVNRITATEDSESRIVVLLTDGANNAGEVGPIAAAEAAAALGVRIYTIAAGRLDYAPYPQLGPDGQPVRDPRGRMIFRQAPTDIDLETLKQIAEITGGRAYHADQSDELESIYEEIDRLERTEATLNVRTLYNDLFNWPLVVGLGLILMEQLLGQTRLRRLP